MKDVSNTNNDMILSLKKIREHNRAHIKDKSLKEISPVELKQSIEKGRAREAVARYKKSD